MTVLTLQGSILTKWKPCVKLLQDQCITTTKNLNGMEDLKAENASLKKKLIMSDVDEVRKIERDNFDLRVVVRSLRGGE